VFPAGLCLSRGYARTAGHVAGLILRVGSNLVLQAKSGGAMQIALLTALGSAEASD
jgi:hypothetical protein